MADSVGGPELGSLTISPDTGQAGTWGTWVVTLKVGADGIATGGGVQVALPLRWHPYIRQASKRLQTTDPTDAFYVSARTSRSDVALRCEMVDPSDDELPKTSHKQIGGRQPVARYGWTVWVTMERGTLSAGDTIDILYGDTSHGGRGMTPPLYTGSPDLVHAGVDSNGDGEHVLLPDERLPLVTHTPGPPVELLIVLPSRSVVGEPGRLRMVALDQFHNPVPSPGIAVSLVVVDGEATLGESRVDLGGPSTLGSRTVSITPTKPGPLRVRGTSSDGELYSRSNASMVFAEPPAERLYWGDLHSHTHYSYDGVGNGDDHFAYAKYGSLLDVYCTADHNNALSMTRQGWQENLEYNEKWNEPGTFVTMVGFEMGFGRGIGHRNVYHRNAEGAYWEAGEIKLQEIWEQATRGETITVPHHTGGTFGLPGYGNDGPHDWSIHDPRFQTTFEIYSSHGHSEEYAPNHPLSMDLTDFTLQGPQNPGSYAQDAWLAGLKMGVIGSSDNHMSQPGKEGFGVIAVWSSSFDRETVFDAIRERRTYGTTGSRIYLEFYVNGHPMGSEIDLARGEAADVHVVVEGTGPLRWIEILRADLDRPDERFTIVHREWFAGMAPEARNAGPQYGFTLDWSDSEPPANGMYYVRTRQRDYVHGRVAEAWSSPVWMARAPG